MPKILHISVAIEMPADEWAEAAQKVAVKPLFDQFAKSLGDAGVKFEYHLDTTDVRAKAAPAIGAKRGRKPKASTFAEIVTQADQHAMDAVKRASTEELPGNAA